MQIDMDDMRIGDVKNILDKIQKGLDEDKWEVAIIEVPDIDVGTDSTTICHMIRATHRITDTVMTIFPNNVPHLTSRLELHYAGDDYAMKVSNNLPMDVLDRYERVWRRFQPIIEKYVRDKEEEKKRKEILKKAEFHNRKASELLDAL